MHVVNHMTFVRSFLIALHPFHNNLSRGGHVAAMIRWHPRHGLSIASKALRFNDSLPSASLQAAAARGT